VATAAGALVVTLATSTAVLWESKRRSDASVRALQQIRNEESSAIQKALAAMEQITGAFLESRDPATGTVAGDDAKRILSFAVGFAQDMPRMLQHDERMQEVVAKALRQSGRGRLLTGDAGGRDDYRRAIQVYEDLAARHPDYIWLRAGLIQTLREY